MVKKVKKYILFVLFSFFFSIFSGKLSPNKTGGTLSVGVPDAQAGVCDNTIMCCPPGSTRIAEVNGQCVCS